MSPGFDSIHDCFYCAKRFTPWEHKNGLISKAYTLKVVDGVKNAIKMRNNDKWAIDVNGRLQFIQCLHAQNCQYDKLCDTNFRTGRPLSSKHSTLDNKGSTKKLNVSRRGRPRYEDLDKASQSAVEYLNKCENEPVTIRDVQSKMGEYLDSICFKRRPYKRNHIKNLLHGTRSHQI